MRLLHINKAVVVLLSLLHHYGVFATEEVKRLGSSSSSSLSSSNNNHNESKIVNNNNNNNEEIIDHRELIFGTIGDAFNDVGNGIGSTVNDVGNGIGSTVNDVGNGISNTANDVGNGVNNAINDVGNFAMNVGNEIVNTIDELTDAITDALGFLGLGQRCGINGECDDGLQCEGGALIGLCLPVRCITNGVIKHANYFNRLLNTENGGGVEYAKQYTSRNRAGRNAIGSDFQRCFQGYGRRSLAARAEPIHGIGALGEAGVVATGSFYYMHVLKDGTVDDKAANILGFCGSAGVAGGVSLKPMYDIIFSDTANDAAGTWTFARFEIAFPIPPVTLGFGISVGVNVAEFLDLANSNGPIFDLRITLILPYIGGIGANFASVAACQAVNAG